MCTLKIEITDMKQVFKTLRIITQVLVFQMITWMLPQKDLWIAHEHDGVHMGALQRDLWIHVNTPLDSDECSTEGLVDAGDQPLEY